MWLLLVLLLKSAMGQHLIQLKERDLVGEDMQLAMLLKRRTSYGGLKLTQVQLPKQYHDNARIYKNIKQSLEASARRNWRFHEPNLNDLKERTVELMQSAIYLTQYRMAHLAEVVKRYSSDIRFRVAYIFCRLDTLLREMRIMFTVQNNSLTARYQYYDRTVHECLVYYSYFLKKNIDITYIVEHMTALHLEYTLSQQTTTVSPEVTDFNSTLPVSPPGSPPGPPPGPPPGSAPGSPPQPPPAAPPAGPPQPPPAAPPQPPPAGPPQTTPE